MLTVARAVGVLCSLALLAVAGGKLYSYARGAQPGRDFRFDGRAAGLEGSPALAMEFADDERQVQQYLDQPGMRQEVRDGLAADNVFIAAYSLLFAGLCVLLAPRGFELRVGRLRWRYAVWLAVFAAVCAAGAAVTDTVENAHTAALLDAAGVTKQLVTNVAAASSEKWALSGLTTLALSPVFLWRGGGRARLFGVGLFLLYLLAGACTLSGVLGGRPRLIVAAFLANFAGSAVIAFVFTLRPGWAAEVPEDAAASPAAAPQP